MLGALGWAKWVHVLMVVVCRGPAILPSLGDKGPGPARSGRRVARTCLILDLLWHTTALRQCHSATKDRTFPRTHSCCLVADLDNDMDVTFLQLYHLDPNGAHANAVNKVQAIAAQAQLWALLALTMHHNSESEPTTL